MNGELAQLVCLASYGNAWLAAGQASPPALEADNPTFRFIGSLEFADASDGWSATSVADWLARLRAVGTRRIWLVIADPTPRPASWGAVDEHLLIGFINVGGWRLLTTSDGGSVEWRGTWVPAYPDRPDRRIWAIRYEGGKVDAGPPSPPPIGPAAERLTAEIQRARDFSERQHLDRWVGQFDSALSLTDAAEDPWPDILSPVYPPEARRLMRMADRAWVFGGMGSWNDEYVEGPEANAEYEAISRDLYAAVLRAVVAAADADLDAAGGAQPPDL